ncbi:hypothetical protein [Anaerotalea alkaliphila]|uniref:Uncharacterized protein n=1 Tax=Anaerotalea alkaliphila TaxID=2662126 RepID=A0A7X5KLY1_9FIRM|nr:hypothetical protein [Anaerotalea alkaliphila]NDL67204.1 hypothetical protein [Anaerotalea alkaliphila]
MKRNGVDALLNREKLILMTKLASYEKNQGRRDLRTAGYFRSNYLSFQNFKTRMAVTAALLLLFLMDLSAKFLDNITNITHFDFVGQFVEYFTIWLLCMLAYTFISNRIQKRGYEEAQKRLNQYEQRLKTLRRL